MKLAPFHRFVGVRYFWEQYFVFTPFSKIIITTSLRWQAQPAIWCCFGSRWWEVEWMWHPPAASGGLQQHWEGDSCKYKHGLIPRPRGLGVRPCRCPVSVHSKCKNQYFKVGSNYYVSVFLVQTFLSRLAAETGGHFHEFTSIIHEEEKVSQHFVPSTIGIACVCTVFQSVFFRVTQSLTPTLLDLRRRLRGS